jgi:putative FmdB family regulatory protein
MPTYEYGCDACGHEFETQQRISDEPLKKCPKCGKLKLQRLISATAFHLKGGGWYKDAYSSSSSKKERTDNDRTDRLTKAIDDDKKKTEKPASTEKKSHEAA